jgi:hypothetical protein
VTITQTQPGQPNVLIASAKDFRGPLDAVESLPGQIVRAWKLAYCREPSQQELVLAVGFLSGQIAWLQSSPESVPEGRTAHRQAMTSFCQALLSSNEFLYVE